MQKLQTNNRKLAKKMTRSSRFCIKAKIRTAQSGKKRQKERQKPLEGSSTTPTVGCEQCLTSPPVSVIGGFCAHYFSGWIGFKKFAVIQADTGYGVCRANNYPLACIPYSITYLLCYTPLTHFSHSPYQLSHSHLFEFSHQL